ncbi:MULTISPECIES: hypothetical protein [Atopobiaceae]|jgi:hypothetical protein|nr:MULTISPECIES: hypothetical protein [Atopobiaceae]
MSSQLGGLAWFVLGVLNGATAVAALALCRAAGLADGCGEE